jgi:hypothetical protein
LAWINLPRSPARTQRRSRRRAKRRDPARRRWAAARSQFAREELVEARVFAERFFGLADVDAVDRERTVSMTVRSAAGIPRLTPQPMASDTARFGTIRHMSARPIAEREPTHGGFWQQLRDAADLES